MECEGCYGPDGEVVFDPYDVDVLGILTKRVLCPACSGTRAEDI
jgi:hypothetical protein